MHQAREREKRKVCVRERAGKEVQVVDTPDKVAEHPGHPGTVKASVDGDTLKIPGISMAE